MAKKVKSTRNMKVCEVSGYRYRPVPSIQLKGQWLNDFGFRAEDPVSVECREGMLIITKTTNNDNDACMAAETGREYR